MLQSQKNEVFSVIEVPPFTALYKAMEVLCERNAPNTAASPSILHVCGPQGI